MDARRSFHEDDGPNVHNGGGPGETTPLHTPQHTPRHSRTSSQDSTKWNGGGKRQMKGEDESLCNHNQEKQIYETEVTKDEVSDSTQNKKLAI